MYVDAVSVRGTCAVDDGTGRPVEEFAVTVTIAHVESVPLEHVQHANRVVGPGGRHLPRRAGVEDDVPDRDVGLRA